MDINKDVEDFLNLLSSIKDHNFYIEKLYEDLSDNQNSTYCILYDKSKLKKNEFLEIKTNYKQHLFFYKTKKNNAGIMITDDSKGTFSYNFFQVCMALYKNKKPIEYVDLLKNLGNSTDRINILEIIKEKEFLDFLLKNPKFYDVFKYRISFSGCSSLNDIKELWPILNEDLLFNLLSFNRVKKSFKEQEKFYNEIVESHPELLKKTKINNFFTLYLKNKDKNNVELVSEKQIQCVEINIPKNLITKHVNLETTGFQKWCAMFDFYLSKSNFAEGTIFKLEKQDIKMKIFFDEPKKINILKEIIENHSTIFIEDNDQSYEDFITLVNKFKLENLNLTAKTNKKMKI